jgi:multidrug efflux system membrane fusion protein
MTDASLARTLCDPNPIHKRAGHLTNSAKVVLVILLAVCASWLGCASSDPKLAASRSGGPGVMPVTVTPVQVEDVPYYLTGLGSVTAFYTVSVKSRVDGELVQVNFREGQNVKQGDLLAVIDPRPFQVQLEQAEAQLFKDQASLRDARLNLTRFKGLLQNSGAMSQQQVDTQASTVDQLDGAVRNDQATVDNAKLQLTYCHITSPVTGRVGLRQVDPGNIVHAADTTPMLVVTQLQPITVIFTLPEDNLPAVAQHMAKGTLPVDAYSRDNQTKLAAGKLLTIDNQIDQTTGTAKLKGVFDNKDNMLWPNQFVNIRLQLNTQKNALVIPAAAVQRGPQGTYVFVMKQDKTVDLRPVTIAFTQNNNSVVSSGVTANEVVVTDGQDKLQAGSKVEPHFQGQGNQPQQAAGTPSSGSTSRGSTAPATSPQSAASPGNTSAGTSSAARTSGSQAQ